VLPRNAVRPQPDTFWREAFTLAESVTPRVLPYVATFGLFAIAVATAGWLAEDALGFQVGLEVGFHEIGGVVLTIALILRTNAGYDRWWEARKLWGGIVNQCRNLVISGLSYGPRIPQWREQLVGWTAAFPYAAEAALERLPLYDRVELLVGRDAARRLADSQHMPSFAARRLGDLLEAAREQGMSPFAFAQVDRERATLIDHVGGCERILKTPLPQVYSIKIRRILAFFLLTLPFVLLDRVDHEWLVPLISVLVAYPLISLDQIGHELQNPFSPKNLSHLALDQLALSIEMNLRGLLSAEDDSPFSDSRAGEPAPSAWRQGLE
jgi:ion channel-forming bestrophin family protein